MRKFKFLLLEVFIGLVIISLIIALGVSFYKNRFGEFPTYTVNFQDVDSLSVGSPVRFMGLNIGHVTKIELEDSNVNVTLKITDKNVKIPKGSMAGVEFTGLAGLRSLEIMPPDGKFPKDKYLHPVEAIRVSSLLEIQNIAAGTLLEISNAVMDFFRQNSLPSTKENVKTFANSIEQKSNLLGETLDSIQISSPAIVENSKELKELFVDNNENINKICSSVNKFAGSDEVKTNLANVQDSLDKVSGSIKTGEAQTKIMSFKTNLNNFSSEVNKLNEGLQKIKDRELTYISEFNKTIKEATQGIQDLLYKKKNNDEKSSDESSNIKTLQK